MTLLTGFWFYWREVSLAEAWKVMVWHPFVCSMRGHVWHEWKTWEEYILVEESWECLRCSQFVYENPAPPSSDRTQRATDD